VISLGDARARVMRDCHRLPDVSVPLFDALGLVTAEEVVSPEQVPPFANTAMDGFAVVAADTVGATDATPVSLPVVGTIAAGSAGELALAPRTAARIMTGAPMPPGADALLMI